MQEVAARSCMVEASVYPAALPVPRVLPMSSAFTQDNLDFIAVSVPIAPLPLRPVIGPQGFFCSANACQLELLQQQRAPCVQEFVKLLCAAVLRATFGVHRLPVALHLVHCISGLRCAAAPAAAPAEWAFFLTGAAAAAGLGAAPAVPQWVPQHARDRFAALAAGLPAVAQAARFEDAAAWSAWCSEAAPESVPAVAAGLTKFQQAIVLQVLHACPEHLSDVPATVLPRAFSPTF